MAKRGMWGIGMLCRIMVSVVVVSLCNYPDYCDRQI